MSTEGAPVFVERRTYRRRRLVDAARLLPIVGVMLVCLPLLWIDERAQPASTTYVMIYFFGLWVALVLAAAQLSRFLRPGDEEAETGLDQDNDSAHEDA